MSATAPLNRRSFLKTGVAGATGLVIGFYLPGKREALAAGKAADVMPSGAAMNAWIQITPEDEIIIMVSKSEMGQGVATSLPMLVAEELECDWKKVQFQFAPRLFILTRSSTCRGPAAAPAFAPVGYRCAKPEPARERC
jgi:isoquinoline 1-oxidoreductase subunit beta